MKIILAKSALAAKGLLSTWTFKFALLSSVGALLLLAAPLGLPLNGTWFDGVIFGFGVNVVFGSAVSAMVMPTESSPNWYKWLYNYGHLIFNRATTHLLPRSVSGLISESVKEGTASAARPAAERSAKQ